MKCILSKGRLEDYIGNALITFVYQNENRSRGILKKIVDESINSGKFSGEKNEIFQVFPCPQLRAGRLIIVGLGKRGKANLDTIRQAAAIAIKIVRKLNKVAYLPIDDSRKTLAPVIEGALLGSYRFDRLKAEKKESELDEISFFSDARSIDQTFIDRIN